MTRMRLLVPILFLILILVIALACRIDLSFLNRFDEDTEESPKIQEPEQSGPPAAEPSPGSDTIPSFNMILVPAGNYTIPIGGLYAQSERDIAETVEAVGGFYIAETEVTFALWYAVRSWAQQNGYDITTGLEGSKGKPHAPPTEASQEPVTCVNWRNAVIWCNALSEMEGKEPIYRSPDGDILRNREDHQAIDAAVQINGNGYRLPTQAEWHLAARYIDGNNWTPCDHVSGSEVPVKDIDETGAMALCEASAAYAVYWGGPGLGGATKTEPVKSRKPNALGIYDMSGNITEWTFTAYGEHRIHAGGEYRSDGWMIQLGIYHVMDPSCADERNGFRIVKDGSKQSFSSTPEPDASKETMQAGKPQQEKQDQKFMDAFWMRPVPPGEYEVPIGWDDADSALVSGGFEMADVPVTYALYHEVRIWAEGNGYIFQNPGWEGSFGQQGQIPETTGQPVTMISFYDSIVWANALSEMSGLEAVYRNIDGQVIKDSSDGSVQQLSDVIQAPANGFRLPTSEEWDLAARYVDGKTWTPGNHASGASAPYDDIQATEQVAVTTEETDGMTAEVRSKAPNALGIYDMSGNIWEWTFTRTGSNRVVRGGILLGSIGDGGPSGTNNFVGLRLARGP